MVAFSTPSPTGAGVTPSRPPPSQLHPHLQRRNIDVENDPNGGAPSSLSGVLSVTPSRPLRLRPVTVFTSVTIPNSLKVQTS
ncbi:hypothetical protein Hanom_Chr03g00186621 [Helianthus anomalus]